MTTSLLTEENPMTTLDQPTLDQPTAMTYRSRSTAMNLFHEALSRARMPKPQEEASRSARRVAMEARRRQARDLGDVSQLMHR
jgi:methylthioribose-1-phosphate isomerase